PFKWKKVAAVIKVAILQTWFLLWTKQKGNTVKGKGQKHTPMKEQEEMLLAAASLSLSALAASILEVGVVGIMLTLSQ
ncbi:hypothetical protein AKJ16_DCAP11254, partial [Drosera capensis]